MNIVFKGLLLSACLLLTAPALAEKSAERESSTTQAVSQEPVNINTASAEELARALKGVGEKRAAAIVQWREANGQFVSLQQLTEVKGIGEKFLELNKDKISLK